MAIIIGASDSPDDDDVAESGLNRGRQQRGGAVMVVVAGCARMNIIQSESDRSKSFPHPGKEGRKEGRKREREEEQRKTTATDGRTRGEYSVDGYV